MSSVCKLGRKVAMFSSNFQKLLPCGTSSVVIRRGSVVEKCTPKQPRAVKKMKELQAYYQNEANKKPIFLKGGVKDQILYRLTILLCGISLGYQGYTYYQMANSR